jgi:hypothetical protein
MKVSDEALKLLERDDISFERLKDGSIRGWMYPPCIGEIFGNSKLEIAEKIVEKQVLNKKKEKSYFKLPTEEDIKNNIRKGSKIKTSYKVRTESDPSYWQFNFNEEILTKEFLLRSIFYEDYYEIDIERTNNEEPFFGYYIKRNNIEINWIFWNKYKSYIQDLV